MQPLRQRVARRQERVRTTPIPAPYKGWNTHESISEMEPEYATILDNFYPDKGFIQLRKGYAEHATGMTGVVEMLAAWNGQGATRKLFAAANNNIYNVTSAGAVGAAETTGATISSNRWQTVNFGTSGGQFLYMVNGADDPRYYDGSAWTVPSLTGISDKTQLITVTAHQGRLWFVEENTAKVWYLAATSVSGALTSIDFASAFVRGGYLMAMGSISLDSGDGLDDMAAFISSRGEVLIYQGSDPSSSATWARVGRYEIAPPIGRRCLLKVGGDLVILTIDGAQPLSAGVRTERAAIESVALTHNIGSTFIASTRCGCNLFGWEMVSYPRGAYAIINVPVAEGTLQHQFVYNVITGAWCRFTGQNANCWKLFNDSLYFGGNDGKVYLADTGNSDNGANIVGDIKTAFNFCGDRNRIKRFVLVRLLITSDGDARPAVEALVDFEDRVPVSVPTSVGTTAGLWDSGLWDVALWGGSDQPIAVVTSVGGVGRAVALRLRFASNALGMSLATSYLSWESGATLG